MRVADALDLTAPPPGAVVGNHGAWLPPAPGARFGVKVPFQWGGQVQKYRHPGEPSYPLDLVWEEVAILRHLATRRMAPPVGEVVYYRTLVSEHPGAWWADPCGAYGYEVADAAALPPGEFSVEALRALGAVAGSPGAWGDLAKPGNVVNGYLVDARRSGWDRLRWAKTPSVLAPVRYQEDPERLRADLLRDGQFPFGERAQPYQEYYLGRWQAAERDVRERARLLGFSPGYGETVLDVGTQCGGFLQYARLGLPVGTPTLVGIDAQAEYVDLARRLARANGWNVCVREWDLARDHAALADWLRALWPGGVDHLLLLSMLKHVPGGEPRLWELVDALKPRRTYLETNAVKEGHVIPLSQAVAARGGELRGYSEDRNRRACYVVSRG